MNKQLFALARRMIEPAAVRVGTACAAYLLGQGVPAELASQAVMALGVFCGVLFDVGVALYLRRR